MTSNPHPPSHHQQPNSPNSAAEKSSYAGAAWQMMYNAKAAVSHALRKDLKQTLDTSSGIHALGQEGKGEDWLVQNCKSVQYFSYRNKLPTPIGTDLDHDAGWGCMVRTGQMMLCVALKRAMKMVYGGGSSGKNGDLSTAAFIDGTSNNNNISNCSNLHLTTKNVDGSTVDLATLGSHEERVKAVVSMFRDIPQADFSIYAIVNAGAKYHIQPGEWFNATSLALSLKHLIVARDSCLVTAVHGRESTVELSDVITSAALGKPVLVMVSVMLGMNNISKNYFPAVHEILGHETSVGIVGGKPKKSMYFFASQKDTLFMLDPHYVQPAFTQKTPIGLPYGNMDWVPMGEADSSMLLCFLLEPNEVAIEKWAQWVEKKLPTLSEYPSFCISRRKMKKQSTATMFRSLSAQSSSPPPTQLQQQQQQQQQPAQTSKQPRKQSIVKNEDEDDFDTMDDFDENGESPSSTLPKNKHANPLFERTPPMGPSDTAPSNSSNTNNNTNNIANSHTNNNNNNTNNSGGLDLEDLLGPPAVVSSNGNNNNNNTNNNNNSQQQSSTVAATGTTKSAEEIGFDDL